MKYEFRVVIESNDDTYYKFALIRKGWRKPIISGADLRAGSAIESISSQILATVVLDRDRRVQ